MNQAGKSNHCTKLFHPLVLTLLGVGNASKECIQVPVLFNTFYFVMRGLASLLNTFCKLLIKSFDPNLVAQCKTVGTRDDEWWTTFLFSMLRPRSDVQHDVATSGQQIIHC